MSKTRSGTIISNYIAVAPGKRTRSSESLRETSGSPSDSPENSHLTSESEAQKSTGSDALESPPPQEVGAKASLPKETISNDGALNDSPPSEGTLSTAPLVVSNSQDAQAPPLPRGWTLWHPHSKRL